MGTEPLDYFAEHGTRDRRDADLSGGDPSAADTDTGELVDPATDESNAITTDETTTPDGSGDPE